MADNIENTDNPTDDMSEYLQTFLDETEEQLDDLVETLLALESDPNNAGDLNEVFRLVHSIKGSAGMMGFDNITNLTHHLENRFERLRSGLARLDESTMNLVLRCVDFLRQCNNRLRNGETLGSSAELLDELKQLEEQATASETLERKPSTAERQDLDEDATGPLSSGFEPLSEEVSDTLIRMVVRFQPGLQLADLKAQLIVARLAGLGEIQSTHPDLDQFSESEQLAEFEVRIETHEDLNRLRAAADVDGVESIDFLNSSTQSKSESTVEEASGREDAAREPMPPSGESIEISRSAAIEESSTIESSLEPEDSFLDSLTEVGPKPEKADVIQGDPATKPVQTPETESSTSKKTTKKVADTMRVDIDRLDNLMNLAGELVVNRARFEQISGQVSPALRNASTLNRIRDFSDDLRRMINSLDNSAETDRDWSALVQRLRAGLELMDEQSDIWENGRHSFKQIGEAIDQLSRVSHSLQKGVLDTRMVPVGPLFNRFKRVVRDLSKERGKKVNLLIHGENTELDKRMIDELGDPLVHLVRNSIDHGLEAPDVRASRGKPEAGTIVLEASHNGNNVYIHVRDDGGGIDAEKIKKKLVDKRIVSESAVAELSAEQALNYIWHPGFSTAQEVTDVSGRGVGMDVVKTRVNQLNGAIEVDSTPQQGTTFTIRLPLTLAIMNCLLIRMRNVTFSVPIDNLREIVSLKAPDIETVHGKQTFDVRGEFIPLVKIDDVFQWHGIDYGYNRVEIDRLIDSGGNTVEVVILHADGKTIGMRVDELLGSQDIVIKSLSDNFIDIRGVSGASILGDGSVCLMLDVGKAIGMAMRPSTTVETRKMAT